MTPDPGVRGDVDAASELETGAIPLSELAGPFDLQATLESGQSYLWDRPDGRMYESMDVHGGDAWYRTVVPPIDGIEWQSTRIAPPNRVLVSSSSSRSAAW